MSSPVTRLVQRRAQLLPVRDQLGDGTRVHHGAREDVQRRARSPFRARKPRSPCLARRRAASAGWQWRARRARRRRRRCRIPSIRAGRAGRGSLADSWLFLRDAREPWPRFYERRSAAIRVSDAAQRNACRKAPRASCYLASMSALPCVVDEARTGVPMSYSIDLSGRVALVTGASSGLGTQFAKTLAKAGAAVVLAGRRIERLKTLRAEIEAEGGDAHVVAIDVTDHTSIKSAVAHAETDMGTLDILINNSGVSTTQRLDRGGARGLRLHHEHQHAWRVLRRARGRQAHACARKGRRARHLHRRAHRQHRFDGRPARSSGRSACIA